MDAEKHMHDFVSKMHYEPCHFVSVFLFLLTQSVSSIIWIMCTSNEDLCTYTHTPSLNEIEVCKGVCRVSKWKWLLCQLSAGLCIKFAFEKGAIRTICRSSNHRNSLDVIELVNKTGRNSKCACYDFYMLFDILPKHIMYSYRMQKRARAKRRIWK